MEAGLKDSSIARLVTTGQTTAAIVLRAIPTDSSDRLKYQNELMQLCGTSLRELTESLQHASWRKEKRPGEMAAADDQKASSGDRSRSRSLRRQAGRARNAGRVPIGASASAVPADEPGQVAFSGTISSLDLVGCFCILSYLCLYVTWFSPAVRRQQ